jgi:hypothetical protein
MLRFFHKIHKALFYIGLNFHNNQTLERPSDKV